MKNQLIAYLEHMAQMGLSHIALAEDSPFREDPTGEPVQARKPTALRRGVRPPEPPPQPPARKPRPRPAMGSILNLVETPPETQDTRALAAAIEGADAVETLANLFKAFAGCTACALATTRTNFVFGEGPQDARLMFVGEGPGREEDRKGRPFVGEAGRLLTKIIEAMGLARNQVFIANVVKCRPPQNRNPLPDEMATCAPILVKQIETIQPEIVVALGGTALRFFRDGPASIVKNRGRFFTWRNTTVMPTFHPAYVLRNPAAKRDVWDDMKQVMHALGLSR